MRLLWYFSAVSVFLLWWCFICFDPSQPMMLICGSLTRLTRKQANLTSLARWSNYRPKMRRFSHKTCKTCKISPHLVRLVRRGKSVVKFRKSCKKERIFQNLSDQAFMSVPLHLRVFFFFRISKAEKFGYLVLFSHVAFGLLEMSIWYGRTAEIGQLEVYGQFWLIFS